jgi:nucleotide-binding universal stress UspA family protein
MSATQAPSVTPVESDSRFGERIVVIEDGGPASRAAVRWVGSRVGRHPAEIRVVSPMARADDEAAVLGQQEAVDRGTLVLHTIAPHATVSAEVLIGDPEDTLGAEARAADVLVIGASHFPLRRDALALRLAAHAACVVVVVPAGWAPSGARTVVGASIDAASDAAIAFAAGHAKRESKELHIVHAWELPVTGEFPPPMTDGDGPIPDMQRRALDTFIADVLTNSSDLEVTRAAEQGAPAEVLRRAAEGADLLVVGRRTRSPLTRLLLGSVSHSLVQNPPCPVAVVPQPRSPLEVEGGDDTSVGEL